MLAIQTALFDSADQSQINVLFPCFITFTCAAERFTPGDIYDCVFWYQFLPQWHPV